MDFYQQVTSLSGVQITEDFAEIPGKCATLAIGSTKTLAFFGGDAVAKAASNQTSIIEFIVEDVDAVYTNIKEFIQDNLVQEPTTMPWGNRSLLFRDPDENLVNFFTPVSPAAMKKFEGKI